MIEHSLLHFRNTTRNSFARSIHTTNRDRPDRQFVLSNFEQFSRLVSALFVYVEYNLSGHVDQSKGISVKMLTIVQADTVQDSQIVRALFWEYLQWANGMVQQNFGVKFDIVAMLEADMGDLVKFLPPSGRLLLAHFDNQAVGIACMRRLGDELAEVKRMFVRPEFRGKAIGHALLQNILDEARHSGYTRIRLDSAQFMTTAHAMYRSAGFHDIEAYPESEIPEAFQAHWVFMERLL